MFLYLGTYVFVLKWIRRQTKLAAADTKFTWSINASSNTECLFDRKHTNENTTISSTFWTCEVDIYYLDYALVLKELVPHTSRIIYLFAFWLGMYICNTISRESNRTESLRIVSTDRPADRKTNQTERCGLSKRFLEFTSLSENDILKIITKFDLVLRQPLHSFPGAKVIRK